jgi:hypothetical protein
MTPFMLAVEALLDGRQPPHPETEPSRTRPVAVATDTQVIIRSLAEQLVSEANAVLRERGEAISLVDDSGAGELAFTLGYGDRTARVQTILSGHTAVGRLVAPGLPADEPRQLATEEELQSLVLSLLADVPTR